MRIARIKTSGAITWEERAGTKPPALQELQDAVGGYIERVPMPRGFPGDMFANEEGLNLGLPVNKIASIIMRRAWCRFALDTGDDPFSMLDPGMMCLVGDVIWIAGVRHEDDCEGEA